MRSKLVLGLAVLALAGATRLEAQTAHPQTRQGFWISVGLGSGSAGMSCDGCTNDSESGLSGNLKLGGTLRPNLLVGAETNGFTKSKDGIDDRMSFLSAIAQYYPMVENGFYVKAGLGLAGVSSDDGTDKLTATSLGYQVGAGYDWRLAQNFSLTPYLNYLRGTSGDAKLNSQSTGVKVTPSLFQFGIGLTWH